MMSETSDIAEADGFVLESSPSHLLHRAQQMAANRSAMALRSAGITLRQFSVLAAVSERQGASQAHLVEMTGIDRSTLADMVARMDTSGLVERSQSEADGRAKAVTLTSAGREALDQAAPAVRAADEALLSLLPKNRRGSFVDILNTLITPSASPAGSDADKPAKAKKKSKSKDKAKAADTDKAKSKASGKGSSKKSKKGKKKNKG